jgi:hypothetical protein
MFAELPAIIQPKLTGESLDTDIVQQVQQDLRHYRARSLLHKDVRDIERDVVNEDPTSVLVHLRATQSPSNTADFITQVDSEFEYSELSKDTYQEVLRELEPESPRLEQLLSEKAKVIQPG